MGPFFGFFFDEKGVRLRVSCVLSVLFCLEFGTEETVELVPFFFSPWRMARTICKRYQGFGAKEGAFSLPPFFSFWT